MTNRTDNFNRADAGSLGTPSDGGSAWVSHAGAWGISSNRGFKSSADSTFEASSLESSVTAVDVQVTMSVIANDGICLRLADNNNFLFAQMTATQMFLYKRVAGTFTQIGTTYNGTMVSGDVFKARIDSANLLSFYQNGVLRVGSFTVADGSTNTKHGIVARDLAGFFDTFSITAIVAGFNAAWNSAANSVHSGGARSP